MTSPYETFNSLVRFQIDAWNSVEHALRDTPGAVTLGRHGILVASAEGAGVQQIANRVGITIGAASRLIDRMVQDGLLDRQAHPSDRRAARIVLTDAGRAALAVTSPAIDAALVTGLGPEGVQRLHAAVASLPAIASDTVRFEVANK